MLKFKKNPSKPKDKVVFKFQFHVTRVPQSGWDKLKVSLIPQDTGKRTNKTEKAFVEYGCCRWPNPIVEAIKFLQDEQYEDKFYKISVGTRTKVLGEVTINLADFASSPASSIALPLENCRGNTVLHAKIFSLTSLRKTQEISVQDDQSSQSDEEMETASVASSATSQASQAFKPLSLPKQDVMSTSQTSYDQTSPKEGMLNGEEPSPSSSITGRRRRFSQGSFPAVTSANKLPRASSLGLTMNDNEATPMHVRSLSLLSMKSNFEPDEKIIQELRMEVVTWQRQARAMNVEAQKLRKEQENMNKEHQESNDKLHRRVEESERTVEELKNQLSYERKASSDAQDSNMHLMLAIQEMEESLEEQRKEMEELSSINHKLESSAHEMKRKFGKELAEKEEVITELRRKMEELQKLEQPEDDLEKQLKELTDENMELIIKLNKITKDLQDRTPSKEEDSNNSELVMELEKKLAETEEFHQMQHTSNEKLMVRLQAVVKELTSCNADLESQLRESDEDIRKLNEELELEKSKYEKLALSEERLKETIETDLKARILQLEMLNSGLEMKMQDSQEISKGRILEMELQVASLEEELERKKGLEVKVEDLEAQVARSKKDTVEFMEKITGMEAEIQFLVGELEASKQRQVLVQSQVTECEKMKAVLAATMNEYKSKWMQQAEECEKHINERHQLEAKVQDLELALETRVKEFEESLSKQKEDNSRYRVQVDSLKLEIDEMYKKEALKREEDERMLNSLQMVLEEEHRRCVQLEELIVTVELDHTMAKEEAGKLKQQVVTLEEENCNIKNHIELYKVSTQELKATLERDHALAEEEFTKKMAILEAENCSLKREIELCKLNAEDRYLQTEDKVKCLVQEMDDLKDKVVLLETEKEFLKQDLDIQVGVLQDEVISHMCSKEALEVHMQDLKSSLAAAEAQLLKLSNEKQVIEDTLHDLEVKVSQKEEELQSILEKVVEPPKHCEEEPLQDDNLEILEHKTENLFVETKQAEVEALKREHEDKEMALQNRIDYLETIIERQMDTGLEQFQAEVARLQEQLSLCAQRERELLSKLSTQDILQKEIRRLQQVIEQQDETMARLRSAAQWDDANDRIVTLETLLTEALDTNALYKSQLGQSLSTTDEDEEEGDTEQVLKRYKRKCYELERELKEMHNRYSAVSLQFAEVVAEKEQLVFALRSLKKDVLKKRRSF